MSDSIPEKGVCRIDFESTDKDDCFDAETESGSEQSECNNFEEDSEVECGNQYKYEDWKTFSKRNCCAREGNESTSGNSSEEESPEKRSKLSSYDEKCETKANAQLELRLDIPNLLESDDKTILRSFFQNGGKPLDDKILKVSESYSEITDAVRKLTERMVLPINHQDIKESFVAHNMEYDKQKKADAELRGPPLEDHKCDEITSSLSQDSMVHSSMSPLERPTANSLRAFRIQRKKSEISTEDNNKPIDESEKIEPNPSSKLDEINPDDDELETCEIQKNSNEDLCEAEASENQKSRSNTDETFSLANQKCEKVTDENFKLGSDEETDFNMAVEALNLLKNKGKSVSTNIRESDLLTESNANFQDSDEPSSTVTQKLEEHEKFSRPKSSTSNTEHQPNRPPLIFDSTLEITDCKTGAKIPIESIYSSASEYFNESGEDHETEQRLNVPKKNDFEISNVLTQLSDTVTCVKVTKKETVTNRKKPVSILSNELIKPKRTNFDGDQTQNLSLFDISIATALEATKAEPSKIHQVIEKACKLNGKNTKPCLQQKSKKKYQLSEHSRSLKSPLGSPAPTENIKSPQELRLRKNNVSKEQNKETTSKREGHKSATSNNSCYEMPSESSTSYYNVTIEKVPKSENTSADVINPCSFEEEIRELKALMEKRTGTRKNSEEKDKVQPEESGELNQLNVLPPKNLPKYGNLEDEAGNFEEFQKFFDFLIISIDEEIFRNHMNDTEGSATFSRESIKNIEVPLDAFSLFISDDIIQRIVRHTNEKLEEVTQKTYTKKVCCYKKPITESEMKAFVGLLLISGALKHNNVIVSEIWSECFGAGIYRATLQETRFYTFLQNVSFGQVKDTEAWSEYVVYFGIGDPWEEFLKNIKKYPLLMFDVILLKKTDDDDSKHHYTTVRKTANFPLRVFFSMLDCAVVRGLAIFHQENPAIRMSVREFLKQIGMSLVIPHLHERIKKPTISYAARDIICSILNKKSFGSPNKNPVIEGDTTLKKHKRCQLCPWNKDRKTKLQCINCHRNMCKEHRAQLCIKCSSDLM